MSDPASARTVLVVGSDRMSTARVEAALHGLTEWRVHVAPLRQLRAAAADRPAAIVIAVLRDGDVGRVLRGLRDASPTSAIILLSADPATVWTPATRALGVRGSLPLQASRDELLAALRAVCTGLFALHPEAVRRPTKRDVNAMPGSALTAREREILELMADGASNRMIAARLGISRHTAKFHVAAVLAKLGARTRAEAVAVALRQGLFTV
jgi:two-component system nitrate/nitrite response regulator NarL